jgi:hypothetical protein
VWSHIGLCLLYVPLATWATWPLLAHAADHVIDGIRLHGPIGLLTQADIFLQAWILSWDTHALLTRPAALLDAPIFHPTRWALARSEHMLGDVPLFAPIYLAARNPILAHQLTTVATYVLSATAVYAVAWRSLGSTAAAFVAGALFALSPGQLAMLPQLQTISTMYLPVVVLAGVEVLAGGRRRWWILLAGALLLQGLCSAYLAVAGLVLAGATLFACGITGNVASRTRVGAFLGAALVAAVLLATINAPGAGLRAAGAVPVTPSPVQAALSAAPVASYVPRLEPPGPATPRFLGFALAALAVAGLVRSSDGAGGRRLRAVAAATAVAGYILSLGPTLHLPGDLSLPLPFRLLGLLPGLGALRAPSRFGVLVALGAALLAACGIASLGRIRRGSAVPLATATALALLGFETSSFSWALLRVEAGDTVPGVYRWIAEHARGEPILELPVGVDSTDYGAMTTQSRYAYFGTYHWSPLLNGYGGYPPDAFFLLMAIARRLPDRRALQDLVDLSGVGWIVVHRGPSPPGWDRADGLMLAARIDDASIYRVTLPPVSDRRARLAWPSAEPTTLGGVRIEPLPAEAMRGTLDGLDVPSRMRAGWTLGGWVTVENRGTRPWPGLAAAPAGLVHVGYRWLEGGAVLDAAGTRLARLAADLAPGERVRVPFAVQAPSRAGRYTLRVTLMQPGGEWFDAHGGPSVETPVEVR